MASKAAVLDSSAILAILFNEPGSGRVIDLVKGGLLSSVNLAEVHTKLMLNGMEPAFAWSRTLNLGFAVEPLSHHHARIAAELVHKTRPLGLSLGDRACLALAIHRKATVYTTDRLWKSIDFGIEVDVIR